MAARASSILDEIRFVPVPDPNTRVEGAVSGQFDYVDSLPVEAYDRIKGRKTTPSRSLLKPFGWPVFVLNTKQGVDGERRRPHGRCARRLSMEDMLAAAFGNKEFFALDGAMYPEGLSSGTRWPASKAPTTSPIPRRRRRC